MHDPTARRRAPAGEQPPEATGRLLRLGGSSSAASDALTAAPPRPGVESCRDDRLLSAAALRLSKHEVAARLVTASPDGAPAAVAHRDGVAVLARPTSAPSGGCSSPAPPTTLLVLVLFDTDAEAVPGFRSHNVSSTLGVVAGAAAEIAQKLEGTVALPLRRPNLHSASERTRSGRDHV